ncbi:coiled-coil domain-containing protein [Brachionus plicatilis]|uniref:Coiled-coil domain-containing protein n=1 Tax=Brachionus plicatilis TaxID=10195 RepID=A0A3M7QBI0_BRAPC|nr:coiled-coil domain-containing protein [Brachionus plicatilis]
MAVCTVPNTTILFIIYKRIINLLYFRIFFILNNSIRKIFNQYAEQLFKISFLPKPNIERLLDTEIQQLNGQIITNKTCYAQLYSKLITEDIDRERNQMDLIEAKFSEFELIDALKILKPPESTKSAVYKWFETFRLNTIRLEHINTNYVNKLQMNFEESNQIIISNMEESLVNKFLENKDAIF